MKLNKENVIEADLGDPLGQKILDFLLHTTEKQRWRKIRYNIYFNTMPSTVNYLYPAFEN